MNERPYRSLAVGHRLLDHRVVDQHVITEWFLKAFGPDGVLPFYDKSSNSFGPTSPDKFLVETDAHGITIEKAFEAIETPASQTAQRLTKYFKPRSAGIYAMVDEDGEMDAGGEARPGLDRMLCWRARSRIRPVGSPSLRDR